MSHIQSLHISLAAFNNVREVEVRAYSTVINDIEGEKSMFIIIAPTTIITGTSRFRQPYLLFAT